MLSPTTTNAEAEALNVSTALTKYLHSLSFKIKSGELTKNLPVRKASC
jgi:hypothetical protein